MKNTTFYKLTTLVLVMVLTVATLSGCKSTTVKPVEEKTLVIAQGVDATMLDPHMNSETPTSNVDRQIFDVLIARNSNMEFEPSLALSWEALDDNTWEIKLRQGVLFHNGEELTSKDVKYSLGRILDPEKKSPQAGYYSAIEEVVEVDKYTVHIVTKNPFPILPARLSTLRVVSMDYVEEVGDVQFKLEPLGSGPYQFVEWVKDERIVLKANEKYWKGAPAIKNVVFKPIPEAASRVMALQAGEVDIIVNVPPHQVATLEKSTKASVAKVASIRSVFLPIVSKPGSPINNPLVRQALNYAVDVQGIIDSLLEGNAVELTQTLANTEFGFDPTLETYGYDLAKAKALLAEAGYPNGFKLTFLAPTGRYMMDKEVAEAVKSQLTALGLEVDLKIQEWGVYVEKLMSRTVDADIFMIGWSSGIFDADGTLFSWFRSGERFGHYQFDADRMAQMDSILDEARTILDTERREELYRQALKMTKDDAAWIPLYQQSDIYGVSNRVQWNPRSDEFIQIYDAKWK